MAPIIMAIAAMSPQANNFAMAKPVGSTATSARTTPTYKEFLGHDPRTHNARHSHGKRRWLLGNHIAKVAFQDIEIRIDIQQCNRYQECRC